MVVVSEAEHNLVDSHVSVSSVFPLDREKLWTCGCLYLNIFFTKFSLIFYLFLYCLYAKLIVQKVQEMLV